MLNFRVDPLSPVPLHHQLQEQVRQAIRDGQIAVGDRLLPELAIAAQAGVSRTTVRAALDQLVHEGLLARRRGRGTVVVAVPPPFPDPPAYRLSATFWQARITATPRVLRVVARRLPLDTAQLLLLGPGETGVEIVRLLVADDTPLAVEQITLPLPEVSAVQSLATSDRDLYAVLERELAVEIDRGIETLHAVLLDGETSRCLQLRARSVGLLLERRTYARDRLVELRRAHMPAGLAHLDRVAPRMHLLSS